ncbi:TPA: hypothetical protein HA241_01055 [Candidatus Woesearchaeota archaeon]|nr:hypothetical protein [Candidatus Woesearchaeota archaeon]
MGGDFIKKTIIVLPAVATLYSQGDLIRYVIDADYPSPIEQAKDSPLDFAGGVDVRLTGTPSTSNVIGLSISPTLLNDDNVDFS